MTNPIIEAAAKIADWKARMATARLERGNLAAHIVAAIEDERDLAEDIAAEIRAMPVPSPCRRDIMPGLDHVANFINALDTSDMSAKDVRTAIYSECLDPSIPESPTS